LEDQYYPVLELEDEIQTFAIVGGSKLDLTPIIKRESRKPDLSFTPAAEVR
jgi:hypothetical protein